MRLSNTLLIAAVFLVANCDPASATIHSQQVTFSAVSSTDAVQSIEAAQLERSGRRSLRSSTPEGKDDKDNDDLSPADEGRQMSISSSLTKQLSKLGSFKQNTGALQKVDEAMAAVKSQKAKTLEQKLMSKLSENQVAQRNFRQYMDEKWTVDVLKTKLGIAKGMAPDSKEYEAFSALLQTRMYVDTLMKIKTPTMRTNGETMLAKITEIGSLRTALKKELGITRATSKTSKEYDALILLTQAPLKAELKVTRNTPKDSKEFQAVILLVEARALNKILA
ncbi:hypothetical protein GQ600_1440 [Phytophthora cactorum]|nr:hypothetical protein GQ600_1440 [Phytophthora cactorum]